MDKECHLIVMDDLPTDSLTARIMASMPDDKARMILHAGFAVFLQYGFRRASMQDIADKAGMSRAALYLHFRNKDDVFRAILENYFRAAAAMVAEALAAHADPVEALRAGFAAQMGDAAEAMMTSAHWEELMSVKQGMSAEVIRVGEANLTAAYADWLASADAAGGVDLSGFVGGAEAVARTITAALTALKYGHADWSSVAQAQRHLATAFGRALRAS